MTTFRQNMYSEYIPFKDRRSGWKAIDYSKNSKQYVTGVFYGVPIEDGPMKAHRKPTKRNTCGWYLYTSGYSTYYIVEVYYWGHCVFGDAFWNSGVRSEYIEFLSNPNKVGLNTGY